MKEYTVTIEDNVDTNLQYIVDNLNSIKSQFPLIFNGTTVQEILQSIIDDRLHHVNIVANTVREKELIDAVKSDDKLYTQVCDKADTIKVEKKALEDSVVDTPVTPIIPEPPVIPDPPVTEVAVTPATKDFNATP